MAGRLVERRLRKVSKRLRELRAELSVIDEQLLHLADDADDLGVRAAIDSPGAAVEYRHARAHVDAMAAHRAHVVATIAELEEQQDHLLDQLSG